MNLLVRTLFKLAGALSRSGAGVYRQDYDLRAATYDSAETRPLLKKITAEFISELGLRPAMCCLDLGCGTGYSALLLDQRVKPSGSVEACDNSEGMLREARRLKPGELSVTHFFRAEMLGFLAGRKESSADFIGSFWSAEYCALDKLFSQLSRVLRKGGAAAMLINTCQSLAELQKIVLPVLLRHPGYIGCFPPINFPPDIISFRRYAEKSGLTVERLEECALEYKFKDSASMVNWLRGSGPAAGLTAAIKTERLECFFAAVKKEVENTKRLNITFRFLKFTGSKK